MICQIWALQCQMVGLHENIIMAPEYNMISMTNILRKDFLKPIPCTSFEVETIYFLLMFGLDVWNGVLKTFPYDAAAFREMCPNLQFSYQPKFV